MEHYKSIKFETPGNHVSARSHGLFVVLDLINLAPLFLNTYVCGFRLRDYGMSINILLVTGLGHSVFEGILKQKSIAVDINDYLDRTIFPVLDRQLWCGPNHPIYLINPYRYSITRHIFRVSKTDGVRISGITADLIKVVGIWDDLQDTMLPFLFFVIPSLFSSFIHFSRAALINITIDDTHQGPNNEAVVYDPSSAWNSKGVCPSGTCSIIPDANRVFYGSWHESTVSPKYLIWIMCCSSQSSSFM